MLKMPFSLVALLLMLIGTLLSLSSPTWFYVWLGMELNLMGFIPIMTSWGKPSQLDSGVKYYLIQCSCSIVILACGSLLFYIKGTWMPSSFLTSTLNLFIMMSALMKMGSAPFHYWLPSVSEGLSWPSLGLLLTWQKIIPLFIIFNYIDIPVDYLFVFILMNTLVGGFGGLNQTSLHGLLAYSSINHLGWILAGASISSSLPFYYFLFYSLIALVFMTFLWMSNIHSNVEFNGLYRSTSKNLIIISLMILSMAGIPPLLGFFMKWIVLISLISNQMVLICLGLVVFSLLGIYYYLILCFSAVINTSKWKYYNHSFYVSILLMGMLTNFFGFFVLWFINI